MAKYQKKIVLVILLSAVFAVAGLWVNHLVNNNQELPEPTEIIDYKPLPDASLNYQEYEGNCNLGSAYSSRPDIYTCKIEEAVFSVCFKLDGENLFLCGVDPLSEGTGAIVKSTGQSPLTGEMTGANKYLVMRLADGSACTPMGSIDLIIDERKALYQCTDLGAVFEEPLPKKNNQWVVEISNMEENPENHTWNIKSTGKKTITTIWK